MKKVILAVALAFACLVSGAQDRYGVTFGLTSAHIANSVLDVYGNNSTQDHIGFVYQHKSGIGFAVQPSLLYQVKSGKSEDNYMSMRYFEVPVGLQWGPDLLLFRPYVELTPFVGCAVGGKVKSFGTSKDIDFSESDVYNPFEYGLGIGTGIDFRRYQFSLHYFWNHDSCFQDTDTRFRSFQLKLSVFL